MILPRISNIQSVPEILGQISGVSSSHKRMKKIHVGKQLFRYSHHVRPTQSFRFLSVW